MNVVELFKFRAVLPIFVIFSLLATAGMAFAGVKGNYVEGEAMVLLRYAETPIGSEPVSSDAAQNYARDVAARADAVVVKTYNALSAATGKIFAHFKSETLTTKELIARLEADPDVISASPNHISHTFGTGGAVREVKIEPLSADETGEP